MPVNLNLNVDESLLSNLLNSSQMAGEDLDEHIISILTSHSTSVLSDSKLLEIALDRARALSDGTEFTLKELLSDRWEQIDSPRAFGRLFKKKAAFFANHERVNSSNKAVYKKFTMTSNDYLNETCSATIYGT